MKKKSKKMGKKQKKTEECLNNIHIRFPTYENECYAKRTWILRTIPQCCSVKYHVHLSNTIFNVFIKKQV